MLRYARLQSRADEGYAGVTAARTGNDNVLPAHQQRWLSADLLFPSIASRLLLECAWSLRGPTVPEKTCTARLDLIGEQ